MSYPDMSFYLQSHLLSRVATDYGLDHQTLVGRYLVVPMAPPPVFGVPPVKSVDVPPPTKKPKRRVEWDSLKHCHGTKNNGTHCCSVMFQGTKFCRHHQGQAENPVPLAPAVEDVSVVQSFSIHTPAYSRRPSFDAGSPPAALDPRAQEVFARVARDHVGCGHLLKKVKLTTGYEGWSLPTGEDFEVEPFFRDSAAKSGLLLAIIQGHLTPCGYIEPCESSCSTMESELPLDVNTPKFITTPTVADEPTDEADSGPCVMNYDLFESMAEALGLDEDLDSAVIDSPDYYPFGIYITSMEEMGENIKKLQKNLAEEGYQSIIEDIDGEEYLIVKHN